MTKLSVSVLGRPRIERDGVAVEINRRKAVALLTYLAVTAQKHDRDKLAGLFWPHETRSAGRAALRRTLTAIRHAVGKEWIAVEGEGIGLNLSGELWLDVAEFESLLQRYTGLAGGDIGENGEGLAILSQLAHLYRSDFMSQFALDSDTDFGEWQFFKAEGLRQELTAILDRLVDAHASRGEYELAVAYARRRLAADPLHEPAHRSLMRLYAARGDRSLALSQYEACARRVRKELEAEPEDETNALHDDIRAKKPVAAVAPRAERLRTSGPRTSAGPAQHDAATPAPRRRVGRLVAIALSAVLIVGAISTIAAIALRARSSRPVTVVVLPVESRSVGSETPPTPSGLDDTLVAELLAGGRIVVRTPLDGTGAQGIAEADYLIRGTVTANGSRVRFSLQLVRVRDETAVWAEVVDRERGNLLAMEREIATEAVSRIRAALGLP